MKKLNILIITSWYPTKTSTGGIFVAEQADALVKVGNKVTVMLFEYYHFRQIFGKREKYPFGYLHRRIRSVYYNFLPTRWAKDPLRFQKAMILLTATLRLKLYLLFNKRPDVIHHHGLCDHSFITAHLSKRFKIPYVFTEHAPHKADHIACFNPYETLAERIRFLHNARCRIAVSDFYKNRYENLFNCEFITVPNLVNQLFFNDIPTGHLKNNKPFTFINIGLLEPHKGQDVLLNAFAEKFKGNSDYKLTIAGSGGERNNLVKLVRQLEIEKQVNFTGNVNRNMVRVLLDKSHILVVSSHFETFGVVILEAMARGLPVLSTRCGGPEELINPSNGVLCEVGSVNDMAEKMALIHKTYNSYDSERIAAKISDKYSEQAVSRQLEQLYNAIL